MLSASWSVGGRNFRTVISISGGGQGSVSDGGVRKIRVKNDLKSVALRHQEKEQPR